MCCVQRVSARATEGVFIMHSYYFHPEDIDFSHAEPIPHYITYNAGNRVLNLCPEVRQHVAEVHFCIGYDTEMPAVACHRFSSSMTQISRTSRACSASLPPSTAPRSTRIPAHTSAKSDVFTYVADGTRQRWPHFRGRTPLSHDSEHRMHIEIPYCVGLRQ